MKKLTAVLLAAGLVVCNWPITLSAATRKPPPSPSTTWSSSAAGPLEESAKRAAQQLAQSQAQASNKKTFLWSGAGLTGAGVAMMILAKGKETCTETVSGGATTRECSQQDNIGMGVAGLATAIVGATVMIVGASKNIQFRGNSIMYRVLF